MRGVIGGAPRIFDACVLSAKADTSGLRSRLVFPGGVIPHGENVKALRDRCIAHLESFGFYKEEIEIQQRNE